MDDSGVKNAIILPKLLIRTFQEGSVLACSAPFFRLRKLTYINKKFNQKLNSILAMSGGKENI